MRVMPPGFGLVSLAADTFRTLDLSAVRLRLREGLQFASQRFGDDICTIIEDEAAGQCFRLDRDASDLVARLDGRRTVGQALAETAATAREPLTEDEAARVCGWLVENDLAVSATSTRAERLEERRSKRRRRERAGKFNPLAIRLPLFDPAPLLQPLAPLARVLFGRLGLLLWLAIVMAGGLFALTHARELAAARPPVTSQHLWPMVALSLALLKIVHELAHAMACQAAGGRPRQAGVLLLLFVPLPFVDVTSAWACPSRLRRMVVSAAGMMVEAVVATGALVVWYTTRSPVVAEAALTLALAATVVTVLFNANPLMRFDGYYLLVDALALPNLAPRAQSLVRGLLSRVFLGLPYRVEERRWPTLLLYGLAAGVWKLIVWGSILAAACLLLGGAGRLLAVAGLLMTVGVGLVRGGRRILKPKPQEHPLRWNVIGGWALLATAACVAVAAGVRRPATLRLTGVVAARESVAVRAATAGFVRDLVVVEGDHVAAGELVAVLENPRVAERLERLQLEHRATALRARTLHVQGELAAWQAARDQLEAIGQRLIETQQQVEGLQLRAPIAGQIVRPNPAVGDLAEWRGRYAATGSELVRIESSGREVVALLDADARERSRAVAQWTVRAPGEPYLVASEPPSMTPRLSRRVPHPLLAASMGGPAAVREGGGGAVELASPAAAMRLPLTISSEAATPLPAGLLVTVRGEFARPVRQDLADGWDLVWRTFTAAERRSQLR